MSTVDLSGFSKRIWIRLWSNCYYQIVFLNTPLLYNCYETTVNIHTLQIMFEVAIGAMVRFVHEIIANTHKI